MGARREGRGPAAPAQAWQPAFPRKRRQTRRLWVFGILFWVLSVFAFYSLLPGATNGLYDRIPHPGVTSKLGPSVRVGSVRNWVRGASPGAQDSHDTLRGSVWV